VIAALLTDHAAADACATAPPRGEEVRIADEEAIISWDPVAKRETFIRRAEFRSTTRSFGFLVPTPTTPELGEAPRSVFDNLADAIRPEVITDTSGFAVSVDSWLMSLVGARMAGDKAGAPPVRVIQTAHVAGFDASTLEADDPRAMSAWLGAHGFEVTSGLTTWLERYVTDHWKITAFVVATDELDGTRFELATRAVKMTFQADRPFYPYREPAAAAKTVLELPPRMLRVFFVSNARYQGTLAAAPWVVKTLVSAPLALPPEIWPAQRGPNVTTVFVDDTSPRQGTDEVYFGPSPETSQIKQPAIIVKQPTAIVIPVEGVAIVLVVGVVAIRRRSRRAR
jgi:hypothetical protein